MSSGFFPARRRIGPIAIRYRAARIARPMMVLMWLSHRCQSKGGIGLPKRSRAGRVSSESGMWRINEDS